MKSDSEKVILAENLENYMFNSNTGIEGLNTESGDYQTRKFFNLNKKASFYE